MGAQDYLNLGHCLFSIDQLIFIIKNVDSVTIPAVTFDAMLSGEGMYINDKTILKSNSLSRLVPAMQLQVVQEGALGRGFSEAPVAWSGF